MKQWNIQDKKPHIERLYANYKLWLDAKEKHLEKFIDKENNWVTDFFRVLYYSNYLTTIEEQKIDSEKSRKQMDKLINLYLNNTHSYFAKKIQVMSAEGYPLLNESFESYKKTQQRHLENMLAVILKDDDEKKDDHEKVKAFFKKTKSERHTFTKEDNDFIIFLLETYECDSATAFLKGKYSVLDDWYVYYMDKGIKGFIERHHEDFGVNKKILLSKWKVTFSVQYRELCNEVKNLENFIDLYNFIEYEEAADEFFAYAQKQIEICNNNLIQKRIELLRKFAPKIDFDNLKMRNS